MNSKTFSEKFKKDDSEHTHATYGAIEIFFDSLRTKKSIASDVIKNHEFLINSGRKKALALNFVTWKCKLLLLINFIRHFVLLNTYSCAQSHITAKPKGNHGARPGDFMQRCVSADSYSIIAKNFFSLYPDYTLAVDVGTKDHDTMLFMQKIEAGGRGKPAYSHIHYNPNINEEVGVATHFVRKMSEHYNLFGYHSIDGNPNAECSVLSWTEAFKFLRLSFNPFTDKRIDLWPADKKNRRWKYTYLENVIPETEHDDLD